MPRYIIIVFCVLIFGVCLVAALRNPILHGDETFHYEQISNFARGHFAISPWITTFPTYHFLMALPGLLVRMAPSPGVVRFLTFCSGLLAIAAFQLAAKTIAPETEFVRTLQFAFFPILFPMFFVIYTDVLSLAFVLLAFLFTLKKEWIFAGFFALAGTAIRQNNVVWSLFFLVFIIYQEGWNRQIWKKIWPLVPSLLLIGFFLLFHHAAVMGDMSKHPISLNTGNVYFFLFTSFFLLLPLQIRSASRLVEILQTRKSLMVLIAAVYFIGVLTFRVDHPYNQEDFSFYLRNRILLFFDSSLPLKAIFLLPATYAFCTFLVTRPVAPQFRLVLPFTLIFLAPSWLIEQRYYLIPFALFLLTRERLPENEEYFAFGVNALVALIFFAGIIEGYFFL
jgi:alpha-1,2-glucosyltransferase